MDRAPLRDRLVRVARLTGATPLREGWRAVNGPCGGCGAAERAWCMPGCALLDPLDYR